MCWTFSFIWQLLQPALTNHLSREVGHIWLVTGGLSVTKTLSGGMWRIGREFLLLQQPQPGPRIFSRSRHCGEESFQSGGTCSAGRWSPRRWNVDSVSTGHLVIFLKIIKEHDEFWWACNLKLRSTRCSSTFAKCTIVHLQVNSESSFAQNYVEAQLLQEVYYTSSL